jgi:hypothetical protein
MGAVTDYLNDNANKAVRVTGATTGNPAVQKWTQDATLQSQQKLASAPGLAPDFTDALVQAAAGAGAMRARSGRGRGSFFNGNLAPDLSAWTSPQPMASPSGYGTK